VKLGFNPAPLLLGFVLGPMLEEHLRRAMLMSYGDPTVFVRHPISLAFLIATALLFLALVLPALRRRRDTAAG
jgi:putative tricarboxylic transport membrane protein